MNISSRSNRYNNHPLSLEVRESEVCGYSRQQNLEFNYPRHIPVPQPVSTLASRNLGSERCSIPEVSAVEVSRSAIASVDPTLPVCQYREQALLEATKNHLSNIHRSLERRLQAAQARGDNHLIRMLESEFRQIALYA
jgi:hypothetical protein